MRKNKFDFVFFSTLYLPHIGGVEVYTANFATELSKRGFRVLIVTCTNQTDNHISKDNIITIYPIKSISLLNGRFPIPISIRQIKKIKSMAYYNNNPVTIIQTRIYPLSIIAAILAHISRSTAIVIDHGSNYISLNPLIKIYEIAITKIIKLFKINFYGVSKISSDWLKNFGITSKGIISNGISMNKTLKKIKKNKNLNLFYAGRLIPEKGIIQLIKAFNKIKNDDNQIKLNIYGQGPLDQELLIYQQSNKNIIYHGNLNHDQFIKEICRMDLLIYPTAYPEGLPTIILETGKYGIPVISTNTGGLGEIITHKKTGYIIKNNNVQEIYNAIQYYQSHKKEFYQYGQNLQKEVNNKYNWSTIVDKFLADLKNEKTNKKQ